MQIVDFLHGKNIIIGDFSPSNLVVTNPAKGNGTGNHKFLPKFLDVDAFRFDGEVPAFQQANTPSWFAPENRAAEKQAANLRASGAPVVDITRAEVNARILTKQSDVFKMGLMALRLFHVPSDPKDDDTQIVYLSERADTTLTRLVGSTRFRVFQSMLDTDPQSRPSVRDVLAAFSR